MADTSASRRLWDNLQTLMAHHERKLNYVVQKAGLGGSAPAQIKGMKPIGLDTLDKIAGVFGLEAWMLLIPKLDPKDLPAGVLTQSKQKRHRQLERAQKILAEEEQ